MESPIQASATTATATSQHHLRSRTEGHLDELSTIEVVTDRAGALVGRLSYDAWGKRRNLDGADSATVKPRRQG
jgi:hypothetical protein